MVRTQIQLADAQLEALRKLSAETGKSIADLTRRAVDLYLEQQRGTTRDVLVERALSAAGKFASGLSDVSTDHDRYLAEAFK
jgi:hypothetical protein